MNRPRATYFWCVGWILASAFSSFAHATSDTPQPEIAWLEDLNQAAQLAKTHNKPLMIHFYGDHCPPCRMLEAKAFRNRELVLSLNDNMIAVKINADQNRQIALHYQVNRWPTDVYLYPDGTVIERGVSNQDPQAYARTVERVAQRCRDWTLMQVADREAKEGREERRASRGLSAFKSKIFGDTPDTATPVKSTAGKWKQDDRRLPEQHLDIPAVKVIDVARELENTGSTPRQSLGEVAAVQTPEQREQQIKELASIPGLGGYCPVALQDYLKRPAAEQATCSPWVPGNQAFSVRHRGRIYRCASEEARQRLLVDPDAFAPMLSGCDVVEFSRSGNLVNGLSEYGFIDQNTGRVYLFANRVNYEEFARQCEPFSPEIGSESGRVAEGPNSTSVR